MISYFNTQIALLFLCLFVTLNQSSAEPMTREEFIQAAAGSSSGDDGYVVTATGDREKFIQYICDHWSTILDEFDPTAPRGMRGLNYITIALAAEDLPPMEYLDFLDKVLDLKETGKYSTKIDSLMLAGRNRKYHFLAVNWQHPRVQVILKRAIKLYADNKVTVAAFEAQASGRLADSYRHGLAEGTRDPETLPGIKLQRPAASLIRQIELLTGKKVPPDPQYDPRPDRRGAIAATDQVEFNPYALWPWYASAGVLMGIAFILWKKRKHA